MIYNHVYIIWETKEVTSADINQSIVKWVEMQSIFFLYECNRSPIRQEIIALLRSKGGIANNYDENGNSIEPEDEDDY